MITIRHYSVDGSLIDTYREAIEAITVSPGDKVEFNLNSQDIESFRKVGDDLKVQTLEGVVIKLVNYFAQQRQYADSILTFDDTLYTATELVACFQDKGAAVIKPVDVHVIQQHESEHYLRMDGTITGLSKTAAYAGSTFLYQFVLDDGFPEEVEIEVLVNDKPMPEWMTMKKISAQKYVLSGIPENDSVGQNAIEIIVHYPEENTLSKDNAGNQDASVSVPTSDSKHARMNSLESSEGTLSSENSEPPSEEKTLSDSEPFGHIADDE